MLLYNTAVPAVELTSWFTIRLPSAASNQQVSTAPSVLHGRKYAKQKSYS
jgi:hypothetical protein